MGFFSMFKRKRVYGGFTSDDTLALAQANSLEMRQLLHKEKILRQKLAIAEIEDRLAEYEDEDDDGGFDFGKLLTDAVKNEISSKMQAPQSQQQGNPMATLDTPQGSIVGKSSLSDVEIEELIKQIPKIKLLAFKSFSENKIMTYLRQNTEYDDDTINRAIKILKHKI